MYPSVEWLIEGEPREAQLEALRRSYYGYSLKQSRDGEEIYTLLRPGHVPARGWGHLLEMRLGKTPTMLNEFELFRRDYSFRNMVVLCPNSYKYDWQEEAERYGVSVPALAYEQSRLKHMQAFVDKAKDGWVLAVNYEALIYDQTRCFLLDNVDKMTIIAADESIRLKNPTGQFFKGAMASLQAAKVRRILTGLPMTQGPQDFYAQGRMIGMFEGKNYYAYRGRYCKMGGFKSKKIVGVKNEEDLQGQIHANCFVAKRIDWADPTNSKHHVLRCDLDAEQKRMYKEMDEEFITMTATGAEITADQVVTKLMKLQQISSGFVFDEDGTVHYLGDPAKTPKMKRLVEFLTEEADSKAVVVFHYRASGDALEQVLSKYKPAVIRGKQWMDEQGRSVILEKTRFQDDPECRVILVQSYAGKYGHDLSGSEGDRCRTMVFYENTYSLDDRTQLEARNTASKQDWSNLYFDMLSSPIEARATQALIRKEDIVTAVLGEYRKKEYMT